MKLKLQYATPPNHQPQPSTAPSSPSIIPPVTTATTSSDTSQTNTFPRRDRRRFKRPTLPRQHSFSSLYQRFQISGNRSRSNSFTSDDDTHSLPGDLADRGESASASCNSLNGWVRGIIIVLAREVSGGLLVTLFFLIWIPCFICH